MQVQASPARAPPASAQASRHGRPARSPTRWRQHRVVTELPIEVVAAEQQVADQVCGGGGAHATAHAGEAAGEGLGVARGRAIGVHQVDVGGTGRKADALQPQIGKAVQFGRLADGVAIGVGPDFDAGEGGVQGVELAIGVAVQVA